MSLVCKVSKGNGRPVVRLSDNPEKVSGEGKAVERYRRVFGGAG